MKYIIYHPDGLAFADAKAEQQAREFLIDDRETITVSTENFINAIRCLVREGAYPHEEIMFYFEEDAIKCSPSGTLDKWPAGFCDYTENWLDRLLGWR